MSDCKLNDSTIWIETFTGKNVNPLDLKEDDICIEDISHALSLMCRFNGHCKQFYSVAEHSIRVSIYVANVDYSSSLKALMHDATEAYFADVTRPIKSAIRDIKIIEKQIESVICKKFNLSGNDELIKKADNILLATEARDLMCSGGKFYYLPESPLCAIITPLDDIESIERAFIGYFNLYNNNKN